MNPEQVREQVVERYSGLAREALAGQPAVDCAADEFAAGAFGAAGYVSLIGNAPTDDATEGALQASLGCGNPVAVADLRPGETVLDLGSGGGLDVLLSARRVGAAGRAYGVDASEEMLALARRHAEQAGARNVEFLRGHIEELPLPDRHVDVVVSNCVVNLSTDKPRVLAEAFRVLRPGGRLGISDVVAADGADPAQRAAAERQVGCAVGTLTRTEYADLLRDAGFTAIAITITRELGGGLSSAIVQARRPVR